MSFTRLLAVARKEVVQILRDSRSLIIVVIMPVTLMLLFGYGVNLDLKGLPIYVYDRDGSQQSQDLLKHFQASEYFHVVRVVNDYPAITSALDDGHAKMGIVIPWDFSQRLRDGGPVQVQALVDATDDNTANVLMGYSQAVVQGYSSEIQLNWLRTARPAVQPAPVSVETRTWYNEDLESSAFIVPGVLALVMSVIGAFLTSLTIAREWERGSMEQLISTPVSAMEIMLGKLAPYFVIGMFDVMVCAVIAIYWFHVPFRGSFLTLLVSSALFLVVVLSLGFFISVIAKKPVRGQPDRAAGYFSSGFSAVGISVSDRADAPGSAVDHAHSSGALLRLSAEEDLSQGDAHGFALCRPDSPGRICTRAGGAGHRAFHKRLE